jgi:hypothetical protein
VECEGEAASLPVSTSRTLPAAHSGTSEDESKAVVDTPGGFAVWPLKQKTTNPVLIQERERYATDKLALRQQLVDKLSDAFLDVLSRANSIPPRTVSPPAGLLPIVGFRPSKRRRMTI